MRFRGKGIKGRKHTDADVAQRPLPSTESAHDLDEEASTVSGARCSRPNPIDVFGLGPLPGLGALAKVVSVDLAAHPLGAVAAVAGTVS